MPAVPELRWQCSALADMDRPTETPRISRSPAEQTADEASAPAGSSELVTRLIGELFHARTPTRSDPTQRQLRKLSITVAASEWFAQSGNVPAPEDWQDNGDWPAPSEVLALFGAWEEMLETAGLASIPLVDVGGLAPALIELRDRLAEDDRQARRREHEVGAERKREQQELQRRLDEADRQIREHEAACNRRVTNTEQARTEAEQALGEVARELTAERERTTQLRSLVNDAEGDARAASQRSLAFAARVTSEFVRAPLAFRAWMELAPAPLEAHITAVAAALPSASLRAQIVAAEEGLSEHFDGDQLITVRKHEAAGGALVEIAHVSGSSASPGALQTINAVLWQHDGTAGALTEIRAIGADPEIDEARLRALALAHTQTSAPRRDAGWDLHTTASTVRPPEFERFARFLSDPHRRRPVLVLTTQSEQPPADDPNELAGALCGAAHVIVLSRAATTELTGRFGEHLGVWNGAARCYPAGFSADSSGEENPHLTRVALADLDPAERRLNLILLASMPIAVPASLLSAADAVGAPAASIPCLHEATAGNDHDQPQTPFAIRIATLTHERDRTRRALESFEQISAAFGAEDAPKTVLEAAERAARDARHLRFAPSAFTSAAESPYRRPDEVYASLILLDRLAGDYEQGELGARLADRAGDLGLDYRSAVSFTSRSAEEYVFNYEGRTLRLGPHLVIGGGGGPVRNVRVYMYRADGKDPDVPRALIVGHIGVHLPAKSGS